MKRMFANAEPATSRLAVWLLAWLLSAVPVLGATIKAGVDRSVITLGETVTLSIPLDTRVPRAPELPALPNINVVGQGSTLQIINTRVQQTFTYRLQPTRAGDLTIPAMQLRIGNQLASTEPITIKVLDPTQAQPGGAPPPFFAKIAVPKTNLYVGEVMDLEVQVYFLEGRLTQYPQLPADSGFTIGKWLKPVESRVALSNQAYNLVTFKVPITPVKAGSLSIGAATLPLIVVDRSRPRDFFFQPERQVQLTAPQLTLQAIPLPSANVPATFAGAVGQYSMFVHASPTNVGVGDPITVRVTINGRGWLDALTFPPQPAWSDFKTYDPNGRVAGHDPNNVSGTKTFEIAIVPQNPGIKSIPPVSFSYFDPNARLYRTLQGPTIPLTVQPASIAMAPLPPAITGTNQAETAATDIAHIKARLGAAAPAVPLITQPWFLALQVVPPALWAAMLVRRKRAEAVANNPRARRRRKVEQFVRENLRLLSQHAAANRSDDFFATVFRLLQEQLGERLNVPASSITESVIDERLRPAGLAEPTCAELHELFQGCNMARFAPVKSAQELSAIQPKIETALQQVQQWEPRA